MELYSYGAEERWLEETNWLRYLLLTGGSIPFDLLGPMLHVVPDKGLWPKRPYVPL